MKDNQLEQSFANYVNRINSYSLMRMNQDSQNKFRSIVLPKLIVPSPFQSKEILNCLEKAKFPKKCDLNTTTWLEFKQRGNRSSDKFANELFYSLESKNVKQNRIVQRLDFGRFQQKIPKTKILQMKSIQKHVDQMMLRQQERSIKTEF